MINFVLPGFYEHYNINVKLLYYKLEHPEWFYDNINIHSIYGSFPFWVWDGGRIFGKYRHATQQMINNVLDTFDNVSLQIVCTAPEVQEKNLYNHFCNMTLHMCENPKNAIIVHNALLESYLREKYPQFKVISSTTKCLNIEDTKKEFDNPNYDLICLNYNLNNNWKFLDSFSSKAISKCELLCNAICPPGCPDRLEHYKRNGEFALNVGKPYKKLPSCFVYLTNDVSELTRTSSSYITPEQIFNEYVPRGFQYFKLEGRSLSDLENVLNYAYYMIKPQHKDDFLLHMLYEDHTNEIYKQELS